MVVTWIERELCHGPGDVQGQAVELDDEQVGFILRAYELDDRGRRVVRRGVYSRAKGRAKSELGAFLVCAEALGPVRFNGWGHNGRPEGRPVVAPFIPCIATEESQADNTYSAVEFMLRNGPIGARQVLDVGLTRTNTPSGGKIQAVTARANSKDGGKETFACFDETHLFITEELRRLHATVRRNLAKRKAAEPWSLETTTAYAPGEESVAERSHKYWELVRTGQRQDQGLLFDHVEAPAVLDYEDDQELLAALRTAYGAAASWIDFERMLAEARDPDVEPSDFARYFLNQPTRRERQQWIAPQVWQGLGTGGTVPAGASVALGMDGSRKFDTTVVAWASRAEDGRVDVDCRVFSARRGAPHHELHEGGQINFEAVEDFVVDLFGEYEVREAAYDPRYLDRSAELLEARLPEARIAVVEPQSKLMRAALTAFERGVRDGAVRHRGDPVVAAHLDWAGVDRGESDEVRKVYKLDRRRPIDAAIAMSLAYWRVTVGQMASAEPLFAWA